MLLDVRCQVVVAVGQPTEGKVAGAMVAGRAEAATNEIRTAKRYDRVPPSLLTTFSTLNPIIISDVGNSEQVTRPICGSTDAKKSTLHNGTCPFYFIIAVNTYRCQTAHAFARFPGGVALTRHCECCRGSGSRKSLPTYRRGVSGRVAGRSSLL